MGGRGREMSRQEGSRKGLGLISHAAQCSQTMLLGLKSSVSLCVKPSSVSYKSGNVFTFLLNYEKLRFGP